MKNLEKFLIEEMALEKIHTYAKLACEDGKPRECYGFLLAPKDKNDGIVYDVILACNQHVSSAYVRVDLPDVKETKREYNSKGYKAIGCWQSHNSMNAFHSSIDDQNLDNLILEAATNCIIGNEREEFISLYPNKICFYQKEGEDLILYFAKPYFYTGESIRREKENYPSIEFKLKEKSVEINIENNFSKLRLTSESFPRVETIKNDNKLIGIVYSLVVNVREENYVEVGIVEWNSNNEIERIRKEKGLVIKQVKVHNLQFSNDELKEEIRRKIKNDSLVRRILR